MNRLSKIQSIQPSNCVQRKSECELANSHSLQACVRVIVRNEGNARQNLVVSYKASKIEQDC